MFTAAGELIKLLLRSNSLVDLVARGEPSEIKFQQICDIFLLTLFSLSLCKMKRKSKSKRNVCYFFLFEFPCCWPHKVMTDILKLYSRIIQGAS